MNPLENGVMLTSVQRALYDAYLANFTLTVPLIQSDHQYHIESSFVNLSLIRQNYTKVEVDNFSVQTSQEESSLAIDEPYYKNKTPVPLSSLFIPLAEEKNITAIRRILVTGRAGIGKTTLCHYFAYQWAKRRLLVNFEYVFWLSLKSLEFYKSDSGISLVRWVSEECISERYRAIYHLTSSDFNTVLHHQRDRCLLLLDGFDEVIDLLQENSPLSKILRDVLSFPNILVTSRLYQTNNISFDRILENIGFTDNNINEYLQKNEPNYAFAIQQFIRRNPLIRSISYIPLNLYLLCELWKSDEYKNLICEKNYLTLTQLYQILYKSLLARTITRLDVQRLKNRSRNCLDWSIYEVENFFHNELVILEEIAFFSLSKSVTELLISRNNIETIFEKHNIDNSITFQDLINLGFLRQTPSRYHYSFIHLIFQEYFAARYLWRVISYQKLHHPYFQRAVNFICENKYLPRYRIVFNFLAGFLSEYGAVPTQDKGDRKELADEKTKAYFWDAILTNEREWIGLRHIELIISLLEQARLDNRLPVCNELLEECYTWIKTSLQEGDDKILFTLRQHLSESLLACPHVAAHCISKLLRSANLTSRSRIILLRTYIVPLVDILPLASEFLLSFFEDVIFLKFSIDFLIDIPWQRLKHTDIRTKLINILNSLLSNEDNSIVIIAINALVGLIDKKEEAPLSGMERLKIHSDPFVRIYRDIAIEKWTEEYQESDKKLLLEIESTNSINQCQAIIAARKLAEIPLYRDTVIKVLFSKLEDKDAHVREKASQILDQLLDSSDSSVVVLKERLWRVMQENERKPVKEENVKINDKPDELTNFKIEALLPVLGDPSTEIFECVVQTIIKLRYISPQMINTIVNFPRSSETVPKALVMLSQIFLEARQVIIDTFKEENEVEGSLSRYSIAKALGQFNHSIPEVESILVKRFKDKINKKDRKVGGEVQQLALLRPRSSEGVNVLVQVLLDKRISDDFLNVTIAEALGEVGQLNSIGMSALIQTALDHPNESAAGASMLALGRIGQATDRVISTLVSALEDIDPVVYQPSSGSMFTPRFRDEEKEHQLKVDHDMKIRLYAVYALSLLKKSNPDLAIRFPQVVTAVVKAYKSGHRDFRKKIANSLVELGGVTNEVIKPLITYLETSDYEDIRWSAAYALGMLGQANPEMVSKFPEIERGLIQALRQTYSIELRAIAARALGRLGNANPKVVNLLEQRLQFENRAMKYSALRSLIQLNQITPEVITTLLEALGNTDVASKDEASKDINNYAIKTLVELGRTNLKVKEVLIPALREKDNDIRCIVSAILVQLEEVTPEVIAGLMLAIKVKNILYRNHVLETLYKLVHAKPEIVSKLLEALQENDIFIRCIAAAVLIKIGQERREVISSLVEMLKCEETIVRCTSVEALGSVSEISFEIFQQMIYLLQNDSSSVVRVSAVKAIGNVKRIFTTELNRNTLFNVLSDLTFATSLKRQEAINLLLEFKNNRLNELLYLLLGLLSRQPSKLFNIQTTLYVLNINFHQLINAYNDYMKSKQVSPTNWHCFVQPLMEAMLKEGIGVGESENGMFVYTPTGVLSICLSRDYYKPFIYAMLEAIKERLEKLNLPTEYQNALIDARFPRYWQRSSFCFFKGYRLSLWGLIPLLTHNRVVAEGKPKSILPYLENVFTGSFERYGNILLYVNLEQEAIKIKKESKRLLSTQTCRNASTYRISQSINEEELFKLLLQQVKSHSFHYVDLSDNGLDDHSMEIMAQFLEIYHSLRILKLSHNRITWKGLRRLLETLIHHPSIKYLLVDDNCICLKPSTCKELVLGLDNGNNVIEIKSLLEQSHIIHLDISMNFIPRGQLLEGNVIVEESLLKLEIPERDRLCCMNIIKGSLKVYSQCETAFFSLFDQERTHIHAKLHEEKGAIALLAYKTGIPPWGEHAFLAIEQVDKEFGQRKLIIADLTNPRGNDVFIRIFSISPDEFFEKTRDLTNTHIKIAYVDRQMINTLITTLFNSRNQMNFNKFSLLPGSTEGVVNCMKWCAKMLQSIGIAPDWETWIPSWAVGGRECTLI